MAEPAHSNVQAKTASVPSNFMVSLSRRHHKVEGGERKLYERPTTGVLGALAQRRGNRILSNIRWRPSDAERDGFYADEDSAAAGARLAFSSSSITASANSEVPALPPMSRV